MTIAQQKIEERGLQSYISVRQGDIHHLKRQVLIDLKVDIIETSGAVNQIFSVKVFGLAILCGVKFVLCNIAHLLDCEEYGIIKKNELKENLLLCKGFLSGENATNSSKRDIYCYKTPNATDVLNTRMASKISSTYLNLAVDDFERHYGILDTKTNCWQKSCSFVNRWIQHIIYDDLTLLSNNLVIRDEKVTIDDANICNIDISLIEKIKIAHKNNNKNIEVLYKQFFQHIRNSFFPNIKMNYKLL